MHHVRESTEEHVMLWPEGAPKASLMCSSKVSVSASTTSYTTRRAVWQVHMYIIFI